MLIIKSKLETLQGNFNKASEILQDVEQVIEEKEFDFLEQKISQEIDMLQAEINRSTTTTDDSTLKEELQLLHLENYLAEAKRIVGK